MRLLFLFLVSCLLSLSLVFAQSLTLSSSSTELVAGKTFTLKLQADAISSLEAVKIQGLEQFQMLGQQSATSVQVVNGNQSVQQILSLQLKANKEGSYNIGPARIQTASGTIDSNIIALTVSPSITSLQEQLKGPRSVEQPLFPWKYLLIVIAGIFGCYVFWRRYMKQKPIIEKHSIVEEIHARPSPDLGAIDRQSKIPHNDDPLFAENSEHLLRNYLQYLWKTNVYHLTYQELLQLNNHQSGVLRVDMEGFRRVLMLLQKARYAKLELDKEGVRKELEKILH